MDVLLELELSEASVTFLEQHLEHTPRPEHLAATSNDYLWE